MDERERSCAVLILWKQHSKYKLHTKTVQTVLLHIFPVVWGSWWWQSEVCLNNSFKLLGYIYHDQFIDETWQQFGNRDNVEVIAQLIIIL